MLNGSRLDMSRKSIEGLKDLEQSLQGNTPPEKNEKVCSGWILINYMAAHFVYTSLGAFQSSLCTSYLSIFYHVFGSRLFFDKWVETTNHNI